MDRFIEQVQKDIPGEGVKQQLEVLCNLYALSLLTAHSGDFLATGYLTSRQVFLAKDQQKALFSAVSDLNPSCIYWICL
jgi:acyl-CoA oxidase